MQLNKMEPGMTVYDVVRHKMGNTYLSSVDILEIKIISINIEKKTVIASKNYNKQNEYSERVWSKWRVKRPKLIKCMFGNYRLAKRGE